MYDFLFEDTQQIATYDRPNPALAWLGAEPVPEPSLIEKIKQDPWIAAGGLIAGALLGLAICTALDSRD